MGNRGRYEFPNSVKESARNDWHKKNPGHKNERLEVDHIIPIWFAKKYGIPPGVITTRKNARALRIKEHKERHRNEPTGEEYAVLAIALLGWITNLL